MTKIHICYEEFSRPFSADNVKYACKLSNRVENTMGKIHMKFIKSELEILQNIAYVFRNIDLSRQSNPR